MIQKITIKIITTTLLCISTILLKAQNNPIRGIINDIDGKPISQVQINIIELQKESYSDSNGLFTFNNIDNGNYTINFYADGYEYKVVRIAHDTTKSTIINFTLKEQIKNELNEVVISGTMKAVSKLESPIPVEVYSSTYFKSNPTPSLFDALQNINGVRPQLNCNICNTGDIHINGLEGPYTMILIDGMPIVSGLATVYGLSGIPQALIDRIEVIKGPASTLYGSEAVGGLINIITKNATNAPIIAADVFATSWQEMNVDFASKFQVTKNTQSLLGVNYFNYSNPVDNNNDNFTDVTLQNRISIFNKWQFKRKNQRVFSFAARYVYEDRWGGEMQWNKSYRGGDEVYGESIYTNRWELFGNYQLPTTENFHFQFSLNGHNQNSVYGAMPFLANQYIAFGQLIWNKTIGKHDLLNGVTYRHTYYDDNTVATAGSQHTLHNQLPGIFVQDEIKLNKKNSFLLGMRYDHNSQHGNIITPRINYKWMNRAKNTVFRWGIGNGYRVANVFTEDHAALTGARDVVFVKALKPERSWNSNINLVKKFAYDNYVLNFDASAFYTFFTNKIIPDYDTDPNKIIYDNLEGHSISKGISLNIDFSFVNSLKIMAGATLMDVYQVENQIKTAQLFTEKFTATWNIGYTIKALQLKVDYTGNVYSPMRLPLLSDTDPRSAQSPWWSIQNIQLTHTISNKIEVYGGIKNFLNWTPNRNNPFIIARAFDPFDKNVTFDNNGQAIATPDNPYGLTFDPSYVYGPNQGIRFFLGLRYQLN